MKKYLQKIILIIFIIFISCGGDINEDTFRVSTHTGLPLLRVTFNGKPAYLLVDSGASKSVLDVRYADYYGFEIGEVTGRASGIGGNVLVANTKNILIRYKDSVINQNFKTSLLGDYFIDTGVAGILGSDYLIREELTLDYKNKVILRKK